MTPFNMHWIKRSHYENSTEIQVNNAHRRHDKGENIEYESERSEMKRSNISGFTLTYQNYYLELVTYYKVFPVCLAFSKGIKTIWRFEL